MPMLTLPAELTQTQARACLGALAPALGAAAEATVVVDPSALQRCAPEPVKSHFHREGPSSYWPRSSCRY